MNHQECAHINYLALDLLIDSQIRELPVEVAKIAHLYRFPGEINYSKSRFENAVIVSKYILEKFGYNTEIHHAEYLAVKMLSPLVVIKELNVSSFNQFFTLTDLPLLIALLRYDTYRHLLSKNAIGKFNIERRALRQFSNWISIIRSIH